MGLPVQLRWGIDVRTLHIWLVLSDLLYRAGILVAQRADMRAEIISVLAAAAVVAALAGSFAQVQLALNDLIQTNAPDCGYLAEMPTGPAGLLNEQFHGARVGKCLVYTPVCRAQRHHLQPHSLCLAGLPALDDHRWDVGS